MKIKQETIEAVNQMLLEIISNYVDLKKSGSIYKGLSPFVSEKTPSFVVTPSKQIWKDFSSGNGGKSPIKFVELIEGLSFPEAVEKCCEITGIPFDVEDKEENELFLDKATKELSDFFVANLNEYSINYVKNRGLNDESIKKWKIGYAPNWDKMINFFNNSIYQKEYLKLKLFGKDRETGKIYTKFYNRLMFPIFNKYNTIVGFSGRDLTGKSKSKYVNSNESELFHKSTILYGLNFVDKAKKKIMLVEGQLDVILSHQYGLDIAVASQGTAFSNLQFNQIKDYNVLIAYDGDKAGRAATVKAVKTFLLNGKNPKVCLLPENKDIADILTTEGKEQLLKYIKKHINGHVFYMKEEVKNRNPEKMVQNIKQFKQDIIDMPAPIQDLLMDEFIKITNGNNNVSCNNKYRIPLEEATIIKYALTNFKDDVLKEISECSNLIITKNLFEKVKHGLEIEEETFNEMFKVYKSNCLIKKIKEIQQRRDISYTDKIKEINKLKGEFNGK